ncbi:GNAT family N-acetyltransferase [Kitasatospora sp. NPDC058965]|uniref:GNAT family N-acetyltransferase n=1 Tax=Kitasatospora sp. NPDC058965 TaxID=3346682 RepID=UPI0036C4AE42
MPTDWTVRTETAADRAAVRAVHLAAFETAAEADLVDALRADADWIPELSLVVEAPDGALVGHVLLTRCRIGGQPALCLAPVAVLPAHQGAGAGSAGIRAALAAARERGERAVTVLGHPGYYPRFGFVRASAHGIRPPMEVPDEAMMALALAGELPAGTIGYARPFGL